MSFLRLSLCLILLAGPGAADNPFPRLSGFHHPLSLKSQGEKFPVPKGIPNLLFYLQRDPDANTVIYQLNLTEQGELNEAEPIKVFWIRYAEKGQQKELNYIHRKFAYSLNFKKINPEKYEFTFVSHDKILFTLRKEKDGNFHVYTTINNQSLLLKRIYVRIEGGTFWVPNVLYVDLEGVDPATGKEATMRYNP